MLTVASDGEDEKALEFNLASVFNNSKLFHFAGQNRVGHTLNYAFMLLSRHTEWQDRAREEIFSVFGDEEEFNTNKLARLKVMEMILNEVMRLFMISVTLTRVAKKDLYLKDSFIPKGLCIELAMQAMHKDPEYWGEDAGKFNPGSFANGVLKMCTPQTFMPFSSGSKHCIAINFAMVEMKIVLAMVLRRFRLLLSPNYKHHPQYGVVQRPKYGVRVILKAL